MKYYIQSSGSTRDYRDLHQTTDVGMLADREYSGHLASIAEKLPADTRSFALAPWYRNPRHHDCPHDAWLLEFSMSTGVPAGRCLSASLVLLGAYHDRKLHFQYTNVSDVSLDLREVSAQTPGDWLADEFDITSDGLVSHEILWSKGPPWRITCERVTLTIMEAEPSACDQSPDKI